jgi:hypothetical protein
VGCVPRAISEFLGANTRIASSRSREGWRSLDFTAKLWKHPAGCSLLVPAPNRCLPERRTRNKPRGPAGEKPPPQGKPMPRSKTAARPNSQRLIAPPPQQSPEYSYATRAMHTWHRRFRALLQCDLPERETNQVPAKPKPIPRQPASSCGSLAQSAGWSAKPLLKNAIGGRLLVWQHAPRRPSNSSQLISKVRRAYA